MPNIASVLKQEIARIARRELRAETESLKKAVAAQRAELAALKRRVQALEAEARKSAKARGRAAPAAAPAAPDGEATARRFSAKGLASNRKRLGLSAEDFGALVGVSGQSIYAWETRRAEPRARHLEAIAALRGLGKREVAARLEALRAGAAG